MIPIPNTADKPVTFAFPKLIIIREKYKTGDTGYLGQSA